MLFNSSEFLIFLIIVFFIYWLLLNKNLKLQNAYLILVSYIFYGWWDWRFLSLIVISSSIDYLVGRQIFKSANGSVRKRLLVISILSNLGILGVFKYYNFFMDSFVSLLSTIGFNPNVSSLKIILPVGISFYTFQTLSYTIDVYRRKIDASNDPVAFFAFVSFFPQLVAGPIERASNLLPQFMKKRQFTYRGGVIGLRLMLWGFFKKLVIADNSAILVNKIFSHYDTYSGGVLVLGAVFFAFQIYGDFSGYSDIARGLARLFGFDLMINFRFPYFSRDIAEFWRRWHISLSTWFRDYLYIPLGGSKMGKLLSLRNIFIIFLVSGLWHGANWTFVVWGGINALYFIPLFLMNSNRKNLDTIAQGRLFPSPAELTNMVFTFVIVCIAWIFFRSETITDAVLYLKHIFTGFSFAGVGPYIKDKTMMLILFFVVLEWFLREQNYLFEKKGYTRPVRWSVYLAIGCIILLFTPKEMQQFIYFQF